VNVLKLLCQLTLTLVDVLRPDLTVAAQTEGKHRGVDILDHGGKRVRLGG
jgi:hypothetical protein